MSSPQPRILMCPPDFYQIQYEINPWMDQAQQVDTDLAAQQWQNLRSLIESVGAQVSVIDPVEGLPDMVFTANAALIYRDRAIVARFRHAERQGEEEHFHRWLTANGFSAEPPPGDAYFEGAGDALFCGDTLFAGYRLRSDAGGLQEIGESLGVRVIPLELVDPFFYHIDTCFCPLDTTSAIYFPWALDAYGRRVMNETVDDLVTAEEDEARRFCCNAVVINRHVITNTGCPKLHAELQSLGFETHATELDEFLKAGGSAKCLTLRLDGEEGAGWKSS